MEKQTTKCKRQFITLCVNSIYVDAILDFEVLSNKEPLKFPVRFMTLEAVSLILRLETQEYKWNTQIVYLYAFF